MTGGAQLGAPDQLARVEELLAARKSTSWRTCRKPLARPALQNEHELGSGDTERRLVAWCALASR